MGDPRVRPVFPTAPADPSQKLSAPRVPPSRYHPAFIPPLIPLLNPAVFNGVKAINAGVKPRPPLPGAPSTPIKWRAPPPNFTAPLPSSLGFSPRSRLASTEHRHLRFSTAVARPPRRRLSSGEARAELPVLLSIFCIPAGELWCTGAAGGRTPVSAPPRFGTLGPRRRRSMVD
jgi:hypothetical protein